MSLWNIMQRRQLGMTGIAHTITSAFRELRQEDHEIKDRKALSQRKRKKTDEDWWQLGTECLQHTQSPGLNAHRTVQEVAREEAAAKITTVSKDHAFYQFTHLRHQMCEHIKHKLINDYNELR